MSDPKDTWNPEDGPPPTAEERTDAATLADALVHGRAAARRRPADPDLGDLVDVALRVRATAHPDAATVRAVAARSVDAALVQARSPWATVRNRWGLAVAASALLAAGAGGLALHHPHEAPRPGTVSRPVTDVFTAPVEPGAGSVPSDRIYESRLRSYRSTLLRGDLR